MGKSAVARLWGAGGVVLAEGGRGREEQPPMGQVSLLEDPLPDQPPPGRVSLEADPSGATSVTQLRTTLTGVPLPV